MAGRSAAVFARVLPGLPHRARTVVTAPGSTVLNQIYNVFMRRNFAYVTSIIVAGVVTERLFNSGFDSFWKQYNRGVSISAVFILDVSASCFAEIV
jgi:hypothetical protein